MANLNFQQPPRSIASASLSNRTGSGGFGGGGGGGALSGHVTPTSGMFPQSNNNYAPSQLSPNRGGGGGGSVQLSGGGVGNVGGGGPQQISGSGGRNSIFGGGGGQRPFSDRRPMQGLGPMVCSNNKKINLQNYIYYIVFFSIVINGIVYAVKGLRSAVGK